VNLASGRGYAFDFYGLRPEAPLLAFLPPLHPWLIALALEFPDPALAYSVIQVVLGTLTVWLLYQLAVGMAGLRVGVLTGWGAALYPPHVLLVSQPHSTVLHACLLIAVLLTCWQLLKHPGIKYGLLAGGLIGLFALGRPQAVLLLPAIIGWLWLNRPPAGQSVEAAARGRLYGRAAAGMVLAAAVAMLPWCIRNTLLFGRPTFVSTNGGVTFWNGNNPFTSGSAHDVYADKLAAYRGVERNPALPDVYQHPEPYPFPPEIEAEMQTMPELELDRAAYRAGLDYIRQEPADWLRLEGQKLVSFWWFRPNLGANPIYREAWTLLYQIQYPFLLAPAVVGLVLSARKCWRCYALLYAVMIFYTLMHVIFNVLTRYRWEIELLMILFAALAVEAGWQEIGRVRRAVDTGQPKAGRRAV
jgi:hypothetical protein